jgi:hypothetical protein
MWVVLPVKQKCIKLVQMSKAKQKGTLAETAVADYLKTFWHNVERRVLSGKNDKGDIAGVPYTTIEVKNHKSYKLSEWMEETERERTNAGSQYGILVVKPIRVGVTKVEKWWAVLPLEQIAGLVAELERLRASEVIKD